MSLHLLEEDNSVNLHAYFPGEISKDLKLNTAKED